MKPQTLFAVVVFLLQPFTNLGANDSCAIALVDHSGQDSIDEEIRAAQARVKQARVPARWLDRLGWLFVAKARSTNDQGYYKLAE